jgi:hypothetical protein
MNEVNKERTELVTYGVGFQHTTTRRGGVSQQTYNIIILNRIFIRLSKNMI